MQTTRKPVELGYLDLTATQLWVLQGEGEWVFDTTGTVESHDPMDRVGGPYRITDYVDSDGDKWFICAVADCAFPCYDLVRGDSWEEAYENYVDWAAEHRHIQIEEADYGDYAVDSEDPTCSFTSDGKPVDTDSVHCTEVVLARIVTN